MLNLFLSLADPDHGLATGVTVKMHTLVCEWCQRPICVLVGDLPQRCKAKSCKFKKARWREALASEIERADRRFLKSIGIAPEV